MIFEQYPPLIVGEGGNRGWDGWIASLTQWTWVCANSGRQWRTEAWCAAVHGVTKSWTQLSDWTTTTLIEDQFPLQLVQFWFQKPQYFPNIGDQKIWIFKVGFYVMLNMPSSSLHLRKQFFPGHMRKGEREGSFQSLRVYCLEKSNNSIEA